MLPAVAIHTRRISHLRISHPRIAVRLRRLLP